MGEAAQKRKEEEVGGPRTWIKGETQRSGHQPRPEKCPVQELELTASPGLGSQLRGVVSSPAVGLEVSSVPGPGQQRGRGRQG